jgi:hypothetical protein
MKRNLILLLGVLAICSVSSLLSAMGAEDFGNAPLNEVNYRDWKGLMPVINHPTRAYHTWVNGNEYFYYSGDTQALNDALNKFANVEAEVREVILLPGPGMTISFNKVKEVLYDWNLHIAGGTSQRFALKEEHTNVWDKYPTIRVLLGGNVNLQKIQVPKAVTVTQLADLRRRYLKGLQSNDREVRAYAAYFLAQWDSHNKSNVPQITTLLDDENKWVRDMAASALKKIRQNIAADEPAAAERRRAMEAEISQFVNSLPRDGAK